MLGLAASTLLGAIVATVCIPEWWNTWPLAVGALCAVVLHTVLQTVAAVTWVGVVKDVNVVLSYTVGVAAIPLWYSTDPIHMLPAVLSIGLICTSVVVMESTADAATDRAVGLPSIAIVVGAKACKAIALLCACGSILVAVFLLSQHAVILFQGIAAGLTVVTIRPDIHLPVRRFAAELIFSLPVLLVVF